MASIEDLEFENLIGDHLVSVQKSFQELLDEDPVEFTIDGQTVRMPQVTREYDPVDRRLRGRLTTIYDAANTLYDKNNPIPLLCHREHMTPVGVCRVCVVDIKGLSRLVPACHYSIKAIKESKDLTKKDVEVSTIKTSQRVKDNVGTLIELLLSDYRAPQEQNNQFGETGENELLTIAHRLGVSAGRFPRGKPKRLRDDTSLLIKVDHDACILCDRCIRGCNEIRKNNVLGRMLKGYGARIAFDLDDYMGSSSCVTCGECMVSCPTGALSSPAVVPGKLPPGGEVPEPETLRDEVWEVEELVFENEMRAKPGETAPKEKGPNGAPRDTEQREVDAAASPGAAPPKKTRLVRLFEGVSHSFLEWNRNAIVRRRFCAGEVLCHEGDYGSTAFILEQGRFEVRIKSPLSRIDKGPAGGLFNFFRHFASGAGRGRRAEEQAFFPIDAPVALKRDEPLAVLDRSDVLFGEMTCMSQYPRSATVTALEDCVVLEIQRNVLYMLQRNKISSKILEGVYRRRTLDTHLRTVKIFAELIPSADEFTKFVNFLRDKVRLVRVHPGQTIVRQGDVADAFYMVRSGFVKVEEKWQGVTRGINYIGPGSYFGEIGLLGPLPGTPGKDAPGERVATCSALDHLDLVRVDKETFLKLLEMFPQVREHLVEVACKRMEENKQQQKQVDPEDYPEFFRQGLYHAGNVLVLDLERCTRCDECTKACSDSHDGVTRLIREGLRYDKYLVASSCRSCLDPVCLVGCPVAAIERTPSGDISIKNHCIGCGKCAENCPYGNINMVAFDTDETRPDPAESGRWLAVRQQQATTCDKCVEIGSTPRCVYACPHEAAQRMEGSELLELVKQRNARG